MSTVWAVWESFSLQASVSGGLCASRYLRAARRVNVTEEVETRGRGGVFATKAVGKRKAKTVSYEVKAVGAQGKCLTR